MLRLGRTRAQRKGYSGRSWAALPPGSAVGPPAMAGTRPRSDARPPRPHPLGPDPDQAGPGIRRARRVRFGHRSSRGPWPGARHRASPAEGGAEAADRPRLPSGRSRPARPGQVPPLQDRPAGRHGAGTHPKLWALDQVTDLKRRRGPRDPPAGLVAASGRGGWESLIADLELLHDAEPSLAVLGRQPSAPMCFQPTGLQRERITGLLSDATISREQELGIALAAGLPDLVEMLRARPPRPPAEPTAAETNVERPRW